jgi:hypothetical protein
MNNNSHCQCVFPAAGEDEVVTIPGSEPGTAFRLFVETSREGYVRLQQLAHNDGLGWYVQKSMVVPREVLVVMLPQLRKAQCLMVPAARSAPAAVPFLRLTSDDEPDTPLRRCDRDAASA